METTTAAVAGLVSRHLYIALSVTSDYSIHGNHYSDCGRLLFITTRGIVFDCICLLH